MLDEVKTTITLITSTSYIECEMLPLMELIEFHNRAVKMWNKMHDAKGGS